MAQYCVVQRFTIDPFIRLVLFISVTVNSFTQKKSELWEYSVDLGWKKVRPSGSLTTQSEKNLQYFGTDCSVIVPTIFPTSFHTPSIFITLKMGINQTGPFLTQSVGSFVTHFGNQSITPARNILYCCKFHEVEGNRFRHMFHNYIAVPDNYVYTSFVLECDRQN